MGSGPALGALSVTAGNGTTTWIQPSANITAASASFTGPVQLQNTLTVSTSGANGNVSFSSTVDALAAAPRG